MLLISVRVSADDSAGVLCTQTYLGLRVRNHTTMFSATLIDSIHCGWGEVPVLLLNSTFHLLDIVMYLNLQSSYYQTKLWFYHHRLSDVALDLRRYLNKDAKKIPKSNATITWISLVDPPRCLLEIVRRRWKVAIGIYLRMDSSLGPTA
jgi:hypothetical protein